MMNNFRGLSIRTHQSFRKEDLYSPNTLQELNLASVKKACKQIESDANLLANRIALLKQEELKAWKKIEDTKKKAREVYFLKRKNEEKIIQKQQKSVQESTNLKSSNLQSAEIRTQKKAERQNILNSIYQQKHQEMMEIRRQKELNERKKRQLQEKMLQTNHNKWQNIKSQEALSALKKQEHMENKIRAVKLEKEKSLSLAEAKKKKKALEVMTLEKIELELIKKIQQTQLLQKEASEELNTALSLPTQVYTHKYFMGTSFSNQTLKTENNLMPRDAKSNTQEKSFDSDSNVDRSTEQPDHYFIDKKFEIKDNSANNNVIDNIQENSMETDRSNTNQGQKIAEDEEDVLVQKYQKEEEEDKMQDNPEQEKSVEQKSQDEKEKESLEQKTEYDKDNIEGQKAQVEGEEWVKEGNL